ncbi:glycoside hydrolase family 1 protein, partial [Enterococcus faecalis]|nr:glycoside hydrolase family 1 protein [Enterococcus faecalis]
VVVDGEYLYEFHYPKQVNGKKAVQVAYNLNLASAKAIEVFRSLDLQSKGGRIGTVLNLTPTYAASDQTQDLEAARFAELWNNKMFLEPAVYG